MFIESIKAQTVTEAAKSVGQSAGLIRNTIDNVLNWIIAKSGSLLMALLFIAIGMRVVGFLLKILKRSFARSRMDDSVSGFLLSGLRVLGYVLVFITAATIVGFEVTSFVTVLGTASLAIGLALQGALSNLAGGVLILILKPFQVGDYIVESDKKNEGTVISIDIFYTRLRTPDNKLVVIPNGRLADNSLMNLTDEVKRRVEIKISIAYSSDINVVKDVVNDILANNSYVLQEEPKNVFIDSFDDSGMTLGIRSWVKTPDYWTATWELREQVKSAFDEKGIEIPYNRLEVDLLGDKKMDD